MGHAPPLIGIVDDEAHFRRALSRLLRAHHYRVIDFARASDFLAETKTRRFDCVLLDLALPGTSGLDVLAALRADPSAPPMIVVSGLEDEDVFERARELNAFECHPKPVSDQVLVGAIERALRR